MTVIYAALFLGSVFYLARIVMDYRALELSALSRIEQLERKIDRIKHRMTLEAPLRDEAKDRVARLRELEHDRQEQIEGSRGDLHAGEDRNRTLSLEIQKKQFQGTTRKARRLVLK